MKSESQLEFSVYPLLSLYCLVAAVVNHIDDTDETYGYFEPLHFLLYGKGMQTWEYSPEYAIRTYAFVLPFVPFCKVLSFLGFSKITIFYGVKFVLGQGFAWAMSRFLNAIKAQFGEDIMYSSLVLLLSSPGIFFSSTSYLPSAACSSLIMGAFSSWLNCNGCQRQLRGYFLSIFFGCIAVIYSGWPFVAVLFVPMGISMVMACVTTKDASLGEGLRSLLLLLFGGVCILILTAVTVGAIDSVMYGKWTFPPLNIALYNVLNGSGDELYGIEPPMYYVKNLLLMVGLATFPLAIASPVLLLIRQFCITLKRNPNVDSNGGIAWVLYLTAFIWMSLLFSRPHKEERFMYPIYPLLCFMGAHALDTILMCLGNIGSFFGLSSWSHKKFAGMFICILIALPPGLSRISASHRNFGGYMQLWTEANLALHHHHNTNTISNKTVVCMGGEWYTFPSHFFVPLKVELAFVSDNFHGLLPQPFSPFDLGGTAAIPPQPMNDKNAEEPMRYLPLESCDFFVLSMPSRDVSSETAIPLSPLQQHVKSFSCKEKEKNCGMISPVTCKRLIDPSRSSSALARAFHIPYYSLKSPSHDSRMHSPIHSIAKVLPVEFKTRLTLEVEVEEQEQTGKKEIDANDDSPEVIAALSCKDVLCVGVDNCLTIVECKENDIGEVPSSALDNLVDIEFESTISTMCWDANGSCLIVSDLSGMIHFVGANGTILFSHQVVPVESSAAVQIECVDLISHCKEENFLLVCCLSTGTVLHIRGIPFGKFDLENNSNMKSMFKSIDIKKFSTLLQSPLKWIHFNDSIPKVLAIDGNGALLSFEFGDETARDSKRVSENVHCLDIKFSEKEDNRDKGSLTFKDMVLVPLDFVDAVLLVDCNGVMRLLNVKSLEVTHSFCSTTTANLIPDSIVTMVDVTPQSNENKAFVFSVSYSSPTASLSPTIETYLLTLNCSHTPSGLVSARIMHIGQNPAPQTLPPYHVNQWINRNQCVASDGLSPYIIAWQAHSKLEILSCHNAELSNCLKNLLDEESKYIAAMPSNEEIMLPSVTAAISYLNTVDCLHPRSNEAIPVASLMDIIRKQSSCHHVMALTRLVVFACPSHAHSILSQAKDLMKGSESKYSIELLSYEKCLITSLICNGLHENNSAHIGPVSLLPCNIHHTWRELIRQGQLEQSSIILQRHLEMMVPGLESGDLASGIQQLLLLLRDPICKPIFRVSSVDDILKWLQSDILPFLMKSTNSDCISWVHSADRDVVDAIAVISDFLIELSHDAESYDGHPFNSLRISKYLSNLTRMLPDRTHALTEVSCESSDIDLLKQKVSNLNRIIELQSLILVKWNQKITFQEASNGGLSGALAIVLRSVPEGALQTKVESQIRPVITKLNENCDFMLHKWIEDTIRHSVVFDDNDSNAHEDHNEKCDESSDVSETVAIRHSRLIAVASCIVHCEVKAKAVLSVLQILPLKSDESDEISAAPLNADSSFQQLKVMIDNVLIDVSVDTREELIESLRFRNLRRLAQKYDILGFDPRNARHAKAAVDTIIGRRNLNSESLSDALAIADAYSSSSLDVPGILTKALLYKIIPSYFSRGRGSHAAAVSSQDVSSAVREVVEVLPRNTVFSVLEGTCIFLLDIIDETSESCRGESTSELVKAKRALFEASVSGALAVSSKYLELQGEQSDHSSNGLNAYSHNHGFRKHTSESFINACTHANLKRIRNLCNEFGIYFGLQDLLNEESCRSLIQQKAQSHAEELMESCRLSTESSRPTCIPNSLRKLSSLMDLPNVFAFDKVMKCALAKGDIKAAMLIAECLVEERKESYADSHEQTQQSSLQRQVVEDRTLLGMCIALCGVAAKKAKSDKSSSTTTSQEKDTVKVTSPIDPFLICGDLLRVLLQNCPPQHMGKAVNLLNSCELILSVYQRVDGSSGSNDAMYSQFPLHKSQSDMPSGDIGGINISDLCGHYFVRDGILMSRAQVWEPLLLFLMEEVQRRQSSSNEVPQSIDPLVSMLQRTENHMLALRTILTTWSLSPSRKQSLSSSVLSLSRKILMASHIDSALAVSCLSAVNYDTMVKELRSAVPSIQSDFSRLRTVAMIGESLAQMWQQEELLVIFQNLQVNAKWWHALMGYGIKVDPKTFQSSISSKREAAIRAVVPTMLEKTSGNLALAVDYCTQFDLEAYYAYLCYIEYSMLQPPSGTTGRGFDWVNQIRVAAASVDESMVLRCFRTNLKKIHTLDYEKIRFVCTWMLEVASEDEEHAAPRDGDAEPTEDDNSVQDYQVYLDIASFLSTLTCPSTFTSFGIDGLAFHDGLPPVYHYRIPFWQLLEHPWKIIDPLLAKHPEFANKFIPLCPLLGIERDEFYSRKAKCQYQESAKHYSSASRDATESTRTSLENSCKVDLTKDHPLLGVMDTIKSISSSLRRISLWQWIYDYEMSSEDIEESRAGRSVRDSSAMGALQLALEEIEDMDLNLVDVETAATVPSLKSRILLELVKQKCVCSLRALDERHKKLHGKSTMDKLVSNVGNVQDLLNAIFGAVVEHAWLLQLRSLRCLHSIVCVYDVMHRSHTTDVLEYLDIVRSVVSDVYAFHSQLSNSEDSANSPGGGDLPTPAKSHLESARHAFIGNQLTDVDSGRLASGDSDSRFMLRTGIDSHAWGSGLGIAGDVSGVSPSSAELRRREDTFKAFSISVLILTCTDAGTRNAYMSQLLAVSNGNAQRSQRRLTSRSKFRAIQAILFIDPDYTASDETAIPGSLTSMGRYLCCLAELQELRLSCSEETLAESIGHSCDTAPHPAPLVNTWIQDEGHQSDVCELARDVLVAATCKSSGEWNSSSIPHVDDLFLSLMSCMIRHSHVKAILHTLSVCCGRGVSCFFRNQSFGSVLFQTLSSVVFDASTRLQQVSELMDTRSETDLEHNPNSSSDNVATEKEKSHAVRPRHILLLSACGAFGSDAWDIPPEDIGLALLRVAACWQQWGRADAVRAHQDDPSGTRDAHSTLELIHDIQQKAEGLFKVSQCLFSKNTLENSSMWSLVAQSALHCAISSISVQRQLSEELVFDSMPQDNTIQGVWCLILHRMETFLTSLVHSAFNAVSTSTTPRDVQCMLISVVLDGLFFEFPGHIAILLLKNMWKADNEEKQMSSTDVVESKSRDFMKGILYCISSYAATENIADLVGLYHNRQQGKVVDNVLRWICSDDDIRDIFSEAMNELSQEAKESLEVVSEKFQELNV